MITDKLASYSAAKREIIAVPVLGLLRLGSR